MKTIDGGPAFPHMMVIGHKDYAGGMTLRDWFAGQALATIISLSQHHDGGWDETTVAAGAYAVADAMLAARSPQETAAPEGK